MPIQYAAGNINSPDYYAQQRAEINPAYAGTPAVRNPTPAAPPPPQFAPSTPLNAPDPNAIRRRISGAYGEAGAGSPYNAAFDTGVQNLYANTAQQMAGYDESQNQINTGYEKNYGYEMQNQDRDMKALMDKMAFQGILSSGITTDERANLGQNYAQRLDQMATARANALNQLQTQRLGTQSDYAQRLGGLESQYTSDVSRWVQEQAQQQAARQMQQAQQQSNADLMRRLNEAQVTGNNEQLEILKQILAAQQGAVA